MNSIFKLITLNIKPVAGIHENRSIRDKSCQQQYEKSEFLYSHKQTWEEILLQIKR